MMNISELSCSELSSLVSSRTLRAVEIADALIERVDRFADANAFTDFDASSVRSDAEQADRDLASGRSKGPLHGIPISFKDNINVKGYATTAGTAGMRHFRPQGDAPVAAILRLAGAIAFGKNNMHELAYGTTTNNALFGAARNPFNPDHVCGGSSGGSACAVAHHMVPASIGTDTGGSVRIPAAFCGLWSYRPSPGRWPKAGIVPISSTRDTPGPIARTASDLALLDSVIVGHTEVSKTSMIKGLRIGIPDDFFWDLADPSIFKACSQALDRLKSMGAVLEKVDARRLLGHHAASTTTIALYEGKVTLEGFLKAHGVGNSYESVAQSVAAEDVRSTLLDQLKSETAVGQERYSEAVNIHRPALQQEYRRIFRDNALDVLAFPTALITPPLIGEEATVLLNGKKQPLFPTIIHNTDVGSNAGIPGISIPVGLTETNLPVGLAFDAAAGADRLLLDVAICLEEQFPALKSSHLS
ncbi:indoleacetamide hydrolase [Rhizobium sp. ICMP 5592]|uniref:indoleacetamide hydrolase n=1 Tax=Rhizobium sp. ICMP 5592 TaxID=2292445 RepID=UPI0018867933|nr:indoleacetamide hydrolase [Rhizobium sp. ICMP 5592]